MKFKDTAKAISKYCDEEVTSISYIGYLTNKSTGRKVNVFYTNLGYFGAWKDFRGNIEVWVTNIDNYK